MNCLPNFIAIAIPQFLKKQDILEDNRHSIPPVASGKGHESKFYEQVID